jgi:hypothetical protein
VTNGSNAGRGPGDRDRGNRTRLPALAGLGDAMAAQLDFDWTAALTGAGFPPSEAGAVW